MLLKHAKQADLTVRRPPGRSSAGSHGQSLSGQNSRKQRFSNQNNRRSSISSISHPSRVSRNHSSNLSSRVSRNHSSHHSSRGSRSRSSHHSSNLRDSLRDSLRGNSSRDSSSRDSSRDRHGSSSGSRTGTGARDSGTTCLISADLIMSAGRRTTASAPSSSNSLSHPSSLTGFYLPVNL